MRKLIVSPAAKRDLHSTWTYIANRSGNPAVAEKYIAEIREAFKLIRAFPSSGRMRDDIRQGYRSYPHESEVILYRVLESKVIISRVIRASRDIRRLLGD